MPVSTPTAAYAASSSDIRPPGSRAERFDLRSVGSINDPGGRTTAAIPRPQTMLLAVHGRSLSLPVPPPAIMPSHHSVRAWLGALPESTVRSAWQPLAL